MSEAVSVSRCPASPLALDPQGLSRPEDFYAAIRNSGPVFVPEIDAWLLTRSEDILETASDVVQFSHRYPAGPHFAKMLQAAVTLPIASWIRKNWPSGCWPTA